MKRLEDLSRSWIRPYRPTTGMPGRSSYDISKDGETSGRVGDENTVQLVADYAERAPNPEGGRLASYLAAIEVTAELVHETFDLPWDYARTG